MIGHGALKKNDRSILHQIHPETQTTSAIKGKSGASDRK
jgi:hypothetical protein